MRRHTGLLAAVGLLLGLVPAGADDVIIRAPFVSVRTGSGGTAVRAPFTRVNVGAPPVVIYGQPQPVEVIGPPAGMPTPAPVVAMTHYDFARTFRPVAGNHEVVLIHPRTGCPVRVCFSLPCGCPDVRVKCDELKFDYGRVEVEIDFKSGGRVRVDYDD